MLRTELTNEILYKISKNILNGNSKFENLHKGESCYIIGNGSSIKYYDLEQFSGLSSPQRYKSNIMCALTYFWD